MRMFTNSQNISIFRNQHFTYKKYIILNNNTKKIRKFKMSKKNFNIMFNDNSIAFIENNNESLC